MVYFDLFLCFCIHEALSDFCTQKVWVEFKPGADVIRKQISAKHNFAVQK